jgi:EmrB/QacA subfamily drug resistance transporter
MPTTAITTNNHLAESDANPQRWTSLFGLCLLTGLVWLTASDISIALPTIGKEFGGSMDSLQWAVNGYFLTGSLIIVGGKLGDLIGRRKLFLIGSGLLIAGSVIAMTASGVSQLVVGRLVEGVGAAAILPTSLAMVAVGFPEAERSKAIGIWIATAWGGQGVGPVIGGALVQALGWQSIFWINIPLGLLAIAIVLKTTPESKQATEGGRLDIPGAVTLVGGIAILSYALVAFDSSTTTQLAAMVGAALALFATFALIESKTKDPLLPLSVFGRRLFTGSVIANLLANIAFGAMVFLMSLYLQDVLGYGALKAGALLLPATITVLIVNVIGQKLTERRIYKLPIALGMLLLAIGCWLLTSLDQTYGSLLPGFILIGIGVGLQITPATELAIDSAGVGEGTASGAFKATSMIGGSLGVAAATAVFQGKAGSIFSADLASGKAAFIPSSYHVDTETDIKHLLDFMTGSFRPVTEGPLFDQVKALTDASFQIAAGNAMWVAAAAGIIGTITTLVLLRGSDGSGPTAKGS